MPDKVFTASVADPGKVVGTVGSSARWRRMTAGILKVWTEIRQGSGAVMKEDGTAITAQTTRQPVTVETNTTIKELQRER